MGLKSKVTFLGFNFRASLMDVGRKLKSIFMLKISEKFEEFCLIS